MKKKKKILPYTGFPGIVQEYMVAVLFRACVCFSRCFLQSGASQRSDRWSFLISGELTETFRELNY